MLYAAPSLGGTMGVGAILGGGGVGVAGDADGGGSGGLLRYATAVSMTSTISLHMALPL